MAGFIFGFFYLKSINFCAEDVFLIDHSDIFIIVKMGEFRQC